MIEMTKDFLEAEILRRAKEHAGCGPVFSITVQPVDLLSPQPNWKLGAIGREGAGIGPECARQIDAVVAEMQTTHRLVRG